jgi:hypothetical protein
VKSEITEDTHEGSDDSSHNLPPVGNGIYSVLMKLERDMPQLIPMHGKSKEEKLHRKITSSSSSTTTQRYQRSPMADGQMWLMETGWSGLRNEKGSHSLTSVGMNSQQEMSKSSKQTPKENKSEMGKEDEQEAAGKNKSKTVEEAEKEELYQAIQSMVASRMSIKSIEEFFLSGKTETKKSQRGLKLGRGRGGCRGIGSGKGRGRGT